MISYTFKYIPVSKTVRHDDREISVYNKRFVYFSWASRSVREGIELTKEELVFFEKYGLENLLVWRDVSPKDKKKLDEFIQLYQSFWELYYFHYEDLLLYAIMYYNRRLSPRISDTSVVRFFVSHAKEIIGFKKRLKKLNTLQSQVALIYLEHKDIFTSTFSKYINSETSLIERKNGKINPVYEMDGRKFRDYISDIEDDIIPAGVGINTLTDKECSIILKHRYDLENEHIKVNDSKFKDSYSEWEYLSRCLKYYGVKSSLESVSNVNLVTTLDKESLDVLFSENERRIVNSWCLIMKRRYEAKAKEEAEKLEKHRLIEAEKERLKEEQKRKEEEARREKYRFNEKNRHNRDSLIAFDEEKHQYSVNGAVLQSVTNFVEGCFPKFDSETMATKTAIKLGVSKQSILDMWEQKGKEGREAGTLMHKKIENYYHGLSSAIDDAYKLFKVFADKMDLQPYRTEWAVFDLKHHIAGTIDFVDFQNGEYIIYDWKRSEKILDNGMPVKINKYGEKGRYPLEHLDNTPYYHYALQLSLYKYILEKNYGLKISDLRLGIFHPSYDKPYVLRMPYLEKEINELFDLRSEVIF